MNKVVIWTPEREDFELTYPLTATSDKCKLNDLG